MAADQPKHKLDPQKELEIALGELEERVDRLRSLYEQYFMGYEKIEPGVQRRDVDRRFTVLRKTQIRNTAQRYRFNVVTQKFNTYVMYWTRICRQIEEGTYKRHVQKANRRFGPGARTREQDFSIDVELGDFEEEIAGTEEMDMDRVLAEANAFAEGYSTNLDGGDTVPPSARNSEPPEEKTRQPFRVNAPASAAAQRAAQMSTMMTPGTSFAAPGAGRREVMDSSPPPDSDATPGRLQPVGSGDRGSHVGPAARVARHAALPPGAKPRILVRKSKDDGPPSTRSIAAPPPDSSPPSTRDVHAGAAGAPSSSVIRPTAAPPKPAIRPIGTGSERQVPAARPAAAPSDRHIPARPPMPSGSDRQIPAARPAMPSQSDRQIPATRPALPSQSERGVPAARPMAPPPLPSGGNRPQIARGLGEQGFPKGESERRVPAQAPTAKTPAVPMSPLRPPAVPGAAAAAGNPVSSRRMPAAPEASPESSPTPSRRPPPPLPSSLSKKK